MNKKFLISIVIILSVIFSFTICLANDNGLKGAAEGVRNVVGGAENAIENAAKDVSNTSKNATNGIENGADNATNHMQEGANTTTNAVTGSTNNAYTATRTAATDNTFMGMNSTAWTWLIIGIAAIAIIALVWYYSMQLNNNNFDNRND